MCGPGQVEDPGAHREHIPAAEAGRAGAAGASRPRAGGAGLLVPAAAAALKQGFWTGLLQLLRGELILLLLYKIVQRRRRLISVFIPKLTDQISFPFLFLFGFCSSQVLSLSSVD